MNKCKDDTGLFDEEQILLSWNRNAPSWVRAVREGEIASRRQITDSAIIEAVLNRSPQTVLDVGCGEGWLARELTAKGIHVTGIDAVAELVEEAELPVVATFIFSPTMNLLQENTALRLMWSPVTSP